MSFDAPIRLTNEAGETIFEGPPDAKLVAPGGFLVPAPYLDYARVMPTLPRFGFGVVGSLDFAGPRPYVPPSRRERLRRRVCEARRRVREAALLLRTGETSYDGDD